GYPDNTFRPGQCLTRAEISTILSRLVDLGWVKVAGDRRVEGWISSVQTNGRQQEIEVTSLAGIQKFRAAGGLYCYKNGEKWAVEKSTSFRCEVILDSRKQAGWINLLEPKSSVVDAEKVRGSVKSVALGEESVMVLNDLNCEDKILRIAWDAVVTGKSARQGFKSLKAGDFVDVDLSGGLVRKATVLEVKTVTGTVGRFDGYRMHLEEGMSDNKPGWFNYWDRARVVDRDGLKKGSVLAGDRVEVTYLDPYPEEIDDEIPLQIKVMN
ncbi:MAG TPA: hypothetical protein PK728_10085, partial [Bacillota bacterium]|nr:hypothetical protein [Bacillota bacterium]